MWLRPWPRSLWGRSGLVPRTRDPLPPGSDASDAVAHWLDANVVASFRTDANPTLWKGDGSSSASTATDWHTTGSQGGLTWTDVRFSGVPRAKGSRRSI